MDNENVQSEKNPHTNKQDPEVIRKRRIIGSIISETTTSTVRKYQQGTRLPRKFLKTWCTTNQCKTWIRKHVNQGFLS